VGVADSRRCDYFFGDLIKNASKMQT